MAILSEHVGERLHRRVILHPGEAVPTDEQAEFLDRQCIRLRYHSGRTSLQLSRHEVRWTVAVSLSRPYFFSATLSQGTLDGHSLTMPSVHLFSYLVKVRWTVIV